jgi:hypothetical protein
VGIARGDRVRAQAPESPARKSTTRKTWGDGLEKIMETACEVDRHHALLALAVRGTPTAGRTLATKVAAHRRSNTPAFFRSSNRRRGCLFRPWTDHSIAAGQVSHSSFPLLPTQPLAFCCWEHRIISPTLILGGFLIRSQQAAA